MTAGLIYSVKEDLISGVEALSETFRSVGLNVKCLVIEELEFVRFQCKTDALSSIDTVYFLTNDITVETLARIFVKNSKTVINAAHLQGRFSKLTVQYLLFENGLLVPDNHFSPALTPSGRLADPMPWPIIAKSHRHMDRRIVMNDENDYGLLRANGQTAFPCYFEQYLADDHIVFKGYVIGTDVYFNATGQTHASPALKRQLIKIGQVFSLEAYSVDCIASCSTSLVFFIDVNPAPAFFGSFEARVRFAEYLKECTPQRSVL